MYAFLTVHTLIRKPVPTFRVYAFLTVHTLIRKPVPTFRVYAFLIVHTLIRKPVPTFRVYAFLIIHTLIRKPVPTFRVYAFFNCPYTYPKTGSHFSGTLNPGAVLTLVIEQKNSNLPKLFLWDPSVYKDTENSYTLYKGVVLGIAGLLAIFLTILFVVKGTGMFPATACLAWGVLLYICVDFGFWSKVASTDLSKMPSWRSGTELFLAVSLVIFLHTYLKLSKWRIGVSIVSFGWILCLIVVAGIGIFRPEVASGLARISIALLVGIGFGVIITFSVNKNERAIMLIPTWVLLIAWVSAMAMTLSGRIENDVVQPALGGGLVLLMLLLSFTVVQHAFAGGTFAQRLISDSERLALALKGSGDGLWDWDSVRGRVYIGKEIWELLHKTGTRRILPREDWQLIIHPKDREAFIAALGMVLETKRGRIIQELRS